MPSGITPAILGQPRSLTAPGRRLEEAKIAIPNVLAVRFPGTELSVFLKDSVEGVGNDQA